MTDRYKTRRYIKLLIAIILVVFLIGYTSYEIQKVVLGPRIKVLSPQNGSLVSGSFTEVIGNAKNITEISLNNRKIYIDEQGNFKEELLLSYGYNALVIRASDKFGRKTEKIIEIIYK